VVAAVVASAVGRTVAGVLPNPQFALGTVIASYILWGIGIPAAMIIMVIYHRKHSNSLTRVSDNLHLCLPFMDPCFCEDSHGRDFW
jgi:hypothetical protein